MITLSSILGFSKAPTSSFDHTHALWTESLTQFIRPQSGYRSRVRYHRWKRHPEKLQSYLKTLQKVDSSQYATWNSNQRKAFLINAYNALNVDLVLSLFPLPFDSLKDLAGFFSSPWSEKRFPLLGKKRSLDWIEHDNLRENWMDPRIHFALCHATRSSPMLRTEAFHAKTLDAELDQATRDFLKRRDLNYWDGDKTLHLSRIFHWYRNDFRRTEGSLGKFLAKWLETTPERKKALTEDQVDFAFEDYDWRLNAN